MSADHERIWLQNADDAKHQGEGRMWCQDKVWPDDGEDGEPTEYVRADLFAALRERLAEVERENANLKYNVEVRDITLGHMKTTCEAAEARTTAAEHELTLLVGWAAAAQGEPDVLLNALRAAEARVKQIRAETIEECAKVCRNEAEKVADTNADRYWQSKRIEGSIRALADANTGKGEQG